MTIEELRQLPDYRPYKLVIATEETLDSLREHGATRVGDTVRFRLPDEYQAIGGNDPLFFFEEDGTTMTTIKFQGKLYKKRFP